MLLAFILAATCMQPPNMDLSGVPCDEIAQREECRCSEGITWDPVAAGCHDDPSIPTCTGVEGLPQSGCPYECWKENGAEWYDVYFRQEGSGTWIKAGSTRGYNKPAGPENDQIIINYWYFWWAPEQNFPRYPITYEFSVKSCHFDVMNQQEECSTSFSNTVKYTATVVTCYENGFKVPCWPGQPDPYVQND